jgi:hypothetical protein
LFCIGYWGIVLSPIFQSKYLFFMKRLLLLFLACLATICGTQAQQATPVFTNSYSSLGQDAGDKVAIAPNGDIFMMGNFNNAGLNMGGGTIGLGGGMDYVVARYTSAGVHKDSRRSGCTGDEVR